LFELLVFCLEAVNLRVEVLGASGMVRKEACEVVSGSVAGFMANAIPVFVVTEDSIELMGWELLEVLVELGQSSLQ
jgi:hypothetical protein